MGLAKRSKRCETLQYIALIFKDCAHTLLASATGILLSSAANAQSQTWPAEAQLKPTAIGRECLGYPMMYEVSVDGDAIAIVTPQQKTR